MTATDLETISREFINFGGIMDICPYLMIYSPEPPSELTFLVLLNFKILKIEQ